MLLRANPSGGSLRVDDRSQQDMPPERVVVRRDLAGSGAAQPGHGAGRLDNRQMPDIVAAQLSGDGRAGPRIWHTISTHTPIPIAHRGGGSPSPRLTGRTSVRYSAWGGRVHQRAADAEGSTASSARRLSGDHPPGPYRRVGGVEALLTGLPGYTPAMAPARFTWSVGVAHVQFAAGPAILMVLSGKDGSLVRDLSAIRGAGGLRVV